jgi:hypothetical protein
MIRSFTTVFATVCLLLISATAQAAPMATTPEGAWAVSEGDLLIEFTPDESAPELTILSASGCNVDVCIYLTGSGLTVDRWRTTGYVRGGTCSRGRFWANGTLVKTSAQYCPSSAGTLSATWESPGRFSDPTQACNSWGNVTGYPCKTISS